ncbi:nucleoside-diphosphate kinase [Streptomyces tubercidicus]|uniref:nucleoside-diphosphate kinase n=1 Tax=Streptomyces tubercidicus TaxID=47759 RepID=UPI002E17F542|nr:nucleoside-diphosphate kinase [Streptomyces tubercidicus]
MNRRSLRRWSVRRRILSVIRNRPGRARPAPCDSARDTHVLVKPDGVSRGLAPEVVRTLRQAGLTVETVGHLRLTRAQAERWYPEKLNEPDGFRTLAYLSEGPMLLLAVVGDDALRRTRRVKKDIRRRFGTDERRNVAHCPETRGERDHERGVFGPLVRPCR